MVIAMEMVLDPFLLVQVRVGQVLAPFLGLEPFLGLGLEPFLGLDWVRTMGYRILGLGLEPFLEHILAQGMPVMEMM